MIFRFSTFFILLFLASTLSAQTLPTYKLYTKTGKAVNFGKMMKAVQKADLIFIGESHNSPLSHWLELKVIKAMDQNHAITIGMEMFETDTQEALNAYLDGSMPFEQFSEKARVWSNYKTDYAPIVEYAKTKKVPMVASNIPNQYAKMVYRNGFTVIEDLVEEERRWIAPMPIPFDVNLPTYKAMMDMVEGHGGENFPKAQAIKDATMANSIVQNWKTDGKFIHINGSYHTKDFEGIIWYINQYQPNTKIMSITTAVQSNIDILAPEHIGSADFILVVDEDVTTSY